MISPFFVFVNNENKLFFAKIDWCIRRESFCGFLRGFFKKPLKARFGTQFQHIMAIIKSTATPCFFVFIVSWGFRPKPRPKDFSGKVLWNFKSFCQNKVVCSAGNSFAYFSYKKGKLGRLPQTPTKGLFGKSPLETQKLLPK